MNDFGISQLTSQSTGVLSGLTDSASLKLKIGLGEQGSDFDTYGMLRIHSRHDSLELRDVRGVARRVGGEPSLFAAGFGGSR